MYVVQSVSVRKVTVYGAVKTNECVFLDHFQVLGAIFGKVMTGKASKKDTPP